MGWGDCGTDSEGRCIGYLHKGMCDHPRCNAEIDRGLSYACGGMHGETEYGCEKYFCEKHLEEFVMDDDGQFIPICAGCAEALLDSGEAFEDDVEGCIVRIKGE